MKTIHFVVSEEISMTEYKLNLTDFQLAILLDTVKGFVDNKKLIHVPVGGGGVAGLPLTQDALEWMLDAYEKAGLEEPAAYTVMVEETQQGPASITIDFAQASNAYAYKANLAEFDEQ
ncbi:hypothetical protein PP175_22450 [Aneurinibacillus sp. Ricciae_BoGa-3]|uniref:hypothetical protein n=1 Tax=Aneurinibacillus sp. Ricciae_BoGa-3 TaxID=3022697 RepID=UPI0023415AA2|nr:hypothetical protein [Aneurinibacillus sp. Ricciae_BoGa-3]WCK54044.1 hypothetical protein PP175_22450 [Aneurinibacillus sp. Ricciae_BoGa-3]